MSLIPDHRSVEAIARQIKASGRAFSVFDVGRLFMESRERYQVRFTRQPAPVPQKGKEGAAEPAAAPTGPEELFQCAADGSLWLTRDEAVRHLLHSPALTKYYRAESVTLDAPKGNWNAVAVCGFSGALLGPPNHHDFQRNVARLHRERFSDMPLERYKSRIRTEKDEALLQKWQESLSTATHYVPVTEEPPPEGAEPPAPLKTVAEMEAHFLRHHAAAAAAPLTKATVPGNIPGKYLSAPLLGLLRTEVERQQRFPMQLVQDLCRDLESQGLRFFKRDKKTTCVCRTRPHFLPDDLALSMRIRSMVEMVRANPGITYTRLVSTLAPHIMLKEAAPAVDPAPAPAAEAAEAPVADAVADTETDDPGQPAAEIAVLPSNNEVPPADAPPPESLEAKTAEAVPAEAMAESTAETIEEVPPEAAAHADAAEAPGEPAVPAAADSQSEAPPGSSEKTTSVSPPAPPPPSPPLLSPEEIVMLQDLRWLVQEGLVTEFQNGELYVLGRPPLPPVEKKPRPQHPKPSKSDPERQAPAEAPEADPEAASEDLPVQPAVADDSSMEPAPEASTVETIEQPAAVEANIKTEPAAASTPAGPDPNERGADGSAAVR